MPIVPSYDNFQASPGALPQVRVSTPTMPNVAGIPAKELGQGLQQVSQVMSREALQAIEEANTLRAEDAYNRLRQKQIDLAYGEERGAFRVEGANVLDRKSKMSFADEYIAEYDKAGSEIAATLTNDEQRKRFNHRAQASRLEFGAQLQRHQAEQVDRWRTGVMRDTVETETRVAMKNPYDVEAIGASVERVRLAVGAEAARNGIPADEAIAKAVGGIHAGVIATALNDDKLDYARQYLKEFGDEIDPKDRMTMTAKLDARDKEVRVMAAAEEAFVYHSDNLVSGESLIREKFKDDPKSAHAALVLYEDRARVMRAEEKRVADEHQNGVLDQLTAGVPWARVMKSEDWKNMDSTDRFRLFTAYQSQQKAAASGSNSAAKESRDELFNSLYADDDGIARMSKSEIGTLRAKGLTQTQVGQLMRRKDALAKGAEDVQVDTDQLNAAMAREGIGEKDKQTRGMIKSAVEAEIYAEQKARGKQLSREEKDKIINRQFLEVDSHWKRKGGLLGGQEGTDKKKYYEVNKKESIVVPKKERESIIGILKNKGIRSWTEDDVRELYLRMAK